MHRAMNYLDLNMKIAKDKQQEAKRSKEIEKHQNRLSDYYKITPTKMRE